MKPLQQRLQRMTDLSRRLVAARDADDWDELVAIDRELATELARWIPMASRSLAERTALAELRELHGEARAHCTDEERRHQRLLAAMRAHREGWMAYGLQEQGQAFRQADIAAPGEAT